MKRVAVILGIILLAGATTASAEYREAPVTNGTNLTGTVEFEGKVPPPKSFKIKKNPEFCGKHPDSTPEGNRLVRQVRVKNGRLQDVVVTIEGIESGKPFAAPSADFAARICQFVPFVSIGVKRGTYSVVNDDPVKHNPHLYEITGADRRTLLSLPLPDLGARIEKNLLIRKGDVVKLECDQHDFMHNWIRIVRNPYYAKVDDEGNFEIGDIPEGTYKVTAWHPTLGLLEQEVTFAGGAKTISFVFKGQ